MPLPWKKARISRISRLVTDLQPPSRGNSLVVETGFPTSLIDLFVKNRDRLKKPSKKNKKQRENQQGLFDGDIVCSDPILLSNTLGLAVPSDPVGEIDRVQRFENLQSQSQRKSIEICNDMVSDDQINRNVISETIAEECNTAAIVDGDNGCGEIERSPFMAVLKMFLVVILALSTTKLAVGITVSAFALILLEYIGKYVFCLFKPCLRARMLLLPLFQRGCSLFYVRRNALISERVSNCLDEKKALVIQGEDVSVPDHKFNSCDFVESHQSECLGEEIEFVESNDKASVGVEANKSMEIEIDSLNCEKGWGRLDAGSNARASDVSPVEVDESAKGVSVLVRETSRRAKIKTKIKKMMPKKLRNGKKNGKDSAEKEADSDILCCQGEPKHCAATEEQENCGKIKLKKLLEDVDDERYFEMPRNQELVRGTSNCKTPGTEHETDNERRTRRDRRNSFTGSVADAGREEKQEQELDGMISTTNICNAESETMSAMATVVEERLENERKGNAGYLILFLVVLIGLVGGRALAIVLTFASVFMMKVFRRHRERVIKR